MSEDQNKFVLLAKQGDQEAITQLYQQTQNMAFFTAMRYVKNEADAQDVLQNAYIAAFSKLDSFDGGRDFAPWLRKIVVNQALNFLRAQKVVFSDGELLEAIEEDEGIIPAHYLEEKEKREKILEIVGMLPDGQRLAITLHYFEGMSVAEIAEVMGVKPGTAKSHLFFGRKAIKEAVLEEEKKGNKLYVLVPIPALTQIFELEAQGAQMPAALSKAVLDGIARSLPAVTGATAAVATAPGGFLAKAVASVPVKVVSIVVVLGVAASAALLANGALSRPDSVESTEEPQAVLADAPNKEVFQEASAVLDVLRSRGEAEEVADEAPEGIADKISELTADEAPELIADGVADELAATGDLPGEAPETASPDLEPEPARQQPAAASNVRMTQYWDHNAMLVEMPFEERSGPGWEPAVQDSDGYWSQRFVYNGIANWAHPQYSGLSSPPYPFRGNEEGNTVIWVPEWGAWYAVFHGINDEEYIISAAGAGTCVRGSDGQVMESHRPR